MSIAEKLQVVAENEQRVYQAGYDKGVAEGGANFETDGHFEVNIPVPSKTIKSYSDTWTGGIPAFAFEDYTELETVYAPKAVAVGSSAFFGCSKLTSIDIGSDGQIPGFGEILYGDSLCAVDDNAFSYCASLRKCKLSYFDDVDSVCGYGVFIGCASLEMVDFSGFSGLLSSFVFEGCRSLTAIVFRNDINRFEVASMGVFEDYNDFNPIVQGTCYIYVASKFLSMYQSDWPEIADKFRALEDYTVDGTVDGELDETKI